MDGAECGVESQGCADCKSTVWISRRGAKTQREDNGTRHALIAKSQFNAARNSTQPPEFPPIVLNLGGQSQRFAGSEEQPNQLER